MAISIELGTNHAILLALQCWVKHSTLLREEKLCEDSICHTLADIVNDTKKQRYWIEKNFAIGQFFEIKDKPKKNNKKLYLVK